MTTQRPFTPNSSKIDFRYMAQLTIFLIKSGFRVIQGVPINMGIEKRLEFRYLIMKN